MVIRNGSKENLVVRYDGVDYTFTPGMNKVEDVVGNFVCNKARTWKLPLVAVSDYIEKVTDVEDKEVEFNNLSPKPVEDVPVKEEVVEEEAKEVEVSEEAPEEVKESKKDVKAKKGTK